MQKHVEQIDRETGEVMQGCMVYIPYRPRLTERWFMAFQDAFEEIAKDPELTLEPKTYCFTCTVNWTLKILSNKAKQI